MDCRSITAHIVGWLNNYCVQSGMNGFIVGVSGGIDSALTSYLCALTKREVTLVNMPILQDKDQFKRATNHIRELENEFEKVQSFDIDLTNAFNCLVNDLPEFVNDNSLALANTRSRIRMVTLYALGQPLKLLVTGTGNKVEDFGVGFFTKYGDGGVDISPIADLNKSQVYKLAKYLGISEEILMAAPTDGLWEDNRNDEDQIGATYNELEWAMSYDGSGELSIRQQEVMKIYNRFNTINRHKMQPIPVCIIPKGYF